MTVYQALKNDEKGTHFSSQIDARDPSPCVTHLTSRDWDCVENKLETGPHWIVWLRIINMFNKSGHKIPVKRFWVIVSSFALKEVSECIRQTAMMCSLPTRTSKIGIGQQWRHRWKGLDLGSNICQFEICGRFLLLRCALWTLYLWHFWRLVVQQQNMLQTWGQLFWKVLHMYYHTRQQTNRVGSKPIKNMITPSYQ